MLQILNIGPGVMAGDELALDIRVEEGAKVVLINQSAAKLHTMLRGSARQNVRLHVDKNAELEYYPGLTIPYRDAEFYQSTDVFLEQGAKFGMLERWSMGRAAYQEAFSFRSLSSRVRVRREGSLVYADALELNPKTASQLGISDRHKYLAAGIWFWDTANTPDNPSDIVRPSLTQTFLIQGSFAGGKYLRCLGLDGLEQVKQISTTLAKWRAEADLPELELSRFGAL